MHLGLKTGPLCPIFHTKLEGPVTLAKFQMAPILSFLLSSGSKKKELRYVCLSEAKASHSHKMWTEVTSLMPHFLKSEHPLGPKKQPRYATLFPQRILASESPLGSPTGPLQREIPASRAFLHLTECISFYLSLSPAREPPPCSLTGSPWVAILHHQSHWSTFHSFNHVCRSPHKGALLHTYGEKHKVTVHRAPRRRKACIQWGVAWFPKGIVMTLLSLPQCHAAFGTIPSTLAWVDQSPISQHVS